MAPRAIDAMFALYRQTDPPETHRQSGVQRTVLPAPGQVDGIILVVGVDRIRREDLRTALLTSGVMAVATSSDLKALELLRHGTMFDAVVIELENAQGSDMALIQQVHRRRPDLPIVAIVADGEPERRTQSRQHGAQYCVPRTNSLDSLANTLRTIVADSRLGRVQTRAGMPGSAQEILVDHNY